jgi:hypothetical protein
MKRRAVLSRTLTSAVDLFNRNPWALQRLQLLPRAGERFHDEDWLWTYHGHPFFDDERFKRAYDRAVAAGGHDYEIRWRVHTVLWAADQASALDGAFVECGTGRGFMASAICEYLDWDVRPFYLYDTFLPTQPDERGLQSATGERSTHYADDATAVARNFKEWRGVELVVGRVPETLLDTLPVAFLHVDLNNAVAEESVVRHFWPRLAPGALMVFDDYGCEGRDDQRESADRLGRELGFSVLALPTAQGLVLR